jgi:thiamine transporter ThiT
MTYPTRPNTKRLVFCALLAALSLVLLTAAALWPTGRRGLCALAGVPVAVAEMRYGPAAGAAAWLTAGLTGLLLLPLRSVALLYLTAFGPYPIVKSFCERRRNRVIEWLLKLLFFNFVLAGFVWLLPAALGPGADLLAQPVWPLVWVGLNVVFAVYDFGLSRLFVLLADRLARLW